MNIRFVKLYIILFSLMQGSASAVQECHEMLKFSAKKLRSDETIDFCRAFNGKALLIVNTASQCGFTPQFRELEALHKTRGEEIAIIGFPSNDFKQEYDDSSRVAEVCYKNYGVTFTMVETSSVKGDGANKMFKRLIEATGTEPSWNFNKYYISKDGGKVAHFPSSIISSELEQAIIELDES